MAARPCRREAECAAWRRARRRPDSRRPAHRVFSIWPVMACRHRESTAPEPSKICARSEEHTSELQSLMRISYAVFCLKKKKDYTHIHHTTLNHKAHTWTNDHEIPFV